MDNATKEGFKFYFTEVSREVYSNACDKGFWPKPPYTNNDRNKGEAIALIHAELSEALEAMRKPTLMPDEHCPDCYNAEVELADVIIRIMDIAIGWNYDVGRAITRKIEYNKGRDYMHGKKF